MIQAQPIRVPPPPGMGQSLPGQVEEPDLGLLAASFQCTLRTTCSGTERQPRLRA